jgi:hypothetical protein
MAQQNRANLKTYFLTGSKPTQSQFGDFVDSVVNIKEEGIQANGSGNTMLSAGITLANSTLDTAGSIRWNGTTFQFRDGTGWRDLNLAAGASQWTTVGPNINLGSGNAGIGVGAGPTYKLEVNINNSAGTANAVDSVRLGNAVFFQDAANAYFSHKNVAATTTYAMAQDTFGNVTINSASTRTITFLEAGTARASINAGVLTVGVNPATTTTLLVVNGNACKTQGGANWLVCSDERLKTDIRPFQDGLELLKKLESVQFKYNGKGGTAAGSASVGLLAQDVREVFPYMVGTFKARLEESDSEETELLTLDNSALTYVMMNSLKELDARLARLEIMEPAAI